ncbi:hypothetical protein [Cellulosimicrobium sp. NPDC057127]|uniref:hypothetical protein n=1 Tax=Cellulosimicrobium sp. NPDC057127 TaxID=3346026 RepID=UPI003629AD43
MESASGIVALAVFLLWFGSYVPHRVRHRQQLVDARTEDRFSGALRVLAVVGPAVAAPTLATGRLGAVGGGVAAVAAGPAGAPRALLGPGPGGSGRPGEPGGAVQRVRSDDRAHQEGEHAMDGTDSAAPRRGATPRAPVTSPVSVPRASPSRLAMLERRAAAARRRLTLTVVLVVAAAATWVVVGLGVAPWWAGVVPTALLALVLVLGRRAVLAAQRADAAWLAERRAESRAVRGPVAGAPPAPRAGRPRVTGHAVHASQLSTQMIPRVGVREPVGASTSGGSEGRATAGRADTSDDAAEGSSAPSARTATTSATPTTSTTAPTATATAGTEASGAEASGAEAVAAEGRPVTGEAATERPAADRDAREKDGRRVEDHVPSGRAWDPVPVPRPTYTMKPSAPRREPAPLPQDEPAAAAAPVVTAPVTPERAEGDVQKPRTETLGLDLNEILARRRAAGQ